MKLGKGKEREKIEFLHKLSIQNPEFFLPNQSKMSSSSPEPLEFVMGTHTFEISSYTLAKSTVGFANYIKSSAFSVAGRKWAIEFYPNGRSQPRTASISIGLRLLHPIEEEVRASFCLMLMDWSSSEWSHKRGYGLMVFKPEKLRWTHNIFIGQSDFEESEYLSDDMLKIKCVLCVAVPPESEKCELDKSADIVEHFIKCFQSGIKTDVNFLVNGKTFLAHRWVLAASSSVFKKAFFDTPIAQGENMQEIVITDMKADTFNSLLYFIYTDSMPSEEDITNSRASILMTQRLLAAADRYEIDKLKSICVNKLCKGLSLDTVATTLVLAEEHNCSKLREVCIEFLMKNKSYVGRSVTDDSDD